MNKKILIGISVFYLAASGCGSRVENSNQKSSDQKNSIENKKLSYHGFEVGKPFNPWDSNSVSFRTPPIGGEGQAPMRGWWGDDTPDIKCQKGSKWFEFSEPESLLSIAVCEDIHKERKVYTKVLDQTEKSEVIGILFGMQSIVKKLTGMECPQDGGGGHPWFEISQKDGTVRILKSENLEKCGKESSEFLHGTAPDLSFLKRFEEIVFSVQK